jgi:BirA family biotin operon repressor/biotin-[acetyl-CoA-carboxylase] ligase
MHFDIRRIQTTASTNDDVKTAAQEGAAEGLVIWALTQSAGRGRQGRQWQSPEGNLYFSVLMRPLVPQKDYGFYSFMTSLAIGDAVRTFLPQLSIELKWPNDVLVGGKKMSGILLEAGEGWLVMGMGINILHTPENPLYPVTSFASETADVPKIEIVLSTILNFLDQWNAVFVKEGFAPLRKAWLERAKKGVMVVRQTQGDVQGTFEDLDEHGNLCLILRDGTKRSFNTGDVFF